MQRITGRQSEEGIGVEVYPDICTKPAACFNRQVTRRCIKILNKSDQGEGSVDIVKSAAENASLVIAQVNPNMPWVHGDSLMDVYDLDILVPVESELVERPSGPVPEICEKIGRNVASLVPSGATIEFGVGRIRGVGRLPPTI